MRHRDASTEQSGLTRDEVAHARHRKREEAALGGVDQALLDEFISG